MNANGYGILNANSILDTLGTVRTRELEECYVTECNLNKEKKKNISQEKKTIKENQCNLKRGKDEFYLRGKEDD